MEQPRFLSPFLLGVIFAITSATAERMPLLMPDDFESLQLVAWRVEQGVPDPHNPLLEPSMPWDSGGVMAHGTVLRDPIDGLWKAWQVSTPGEERLDGLKTNHENQRRLTYLESKDGVDWYRPMLPYVRWPGHDRTNIIFDMDSGGTAVYASVHVDPANKEWPYEMFVMRSPKLGGVPNRVGHLPGPDEKLGNYRYRSTDGKEWKLVEGPIHPSVGGGGDVSYVYREPDGSYVSYFKTYPKLRDGDRIVTYDNNPRGGLRSVARRTSPDGTNWGNDALVLTRDWRDPDYAQFLEICPVTVDGGYVALINYYDAAIQTMSLQLAASRDGIHWWRPDRRPALPNPPLGDYGGGMIWQMHHPIVEDNRMHVYYAGSEGIHGEIVDTRFEPLVEVGGESVLGFQTPTLPFNTALCRATWQFDRLWALVPSAGGATLGEAVTRPENLAGSGMALNVVVRDGGMLRVELLDLTGSPISGFSADDCTPITGDHRNIVVRWTGGATAPTTAIRARFILKRSFLYGYAWTVRKP
ncbi:MAG: hypothetical protein DRP71_15740 [Verrucomicrobia bacterium]|nr:MAG: hypothetical protein DRP71_15740 [Verrucomicrobiota bacterium]